MGEMTARLGLPLLAAGQGQKDVTHNEALLALDGLVQPAVEVRSLSIPPSTPLSGQCWLVPAGATGAWTGRTDLLACWSAGGWRFLVVPEGATVWVKSEALRVRRLASGWAVEAGSVAPLAAIAAPSGGSVIDLEARAALLALIGVLGDLGLILR